MDDENGGGAGDDARRRVLEVMAKERAEAGQGGPRVVQDRIPRCAGPAAEGPRDPQAAAHYAQALAALAAGAMDAAEEALRRSLARDDSALAAWRELAMALVEQGRYDEAERPLARVLGADPSDFELVRFRAIARERAGRLAEAIEDYRLFMTLSPPERSKPRTHAAMRLEQLEREVAGGGMPDPAGGPQVEELPPERPPAVRPGLVALLVLAWGWVLWGELAGEPPPPPRPAGKLTVAYVRGLAERADEPALDELVRVVVEGHAELNRPPVEAAMDALVARGGQREIDALVVALAVVMRHSGLRAWERAHRDGVVAALRKLDPAAVAEALDRQLEYLGTPVAEADKRVVRELEAERDRARAEAPR